ncbi:MAG: hypothetical protein M1831_001633 [Alyxoria varia]|nr:MAG: hypothetical protein M1831_001633 [Alyxoria varia]
MADVTPPPLHGAGAGEGAGPSAKEKKYDRQLRLWAASGQAALEDAHILLINSGSGVVGVETLKNLVLPGIGQFTILDASLVTEADLGINFFLTAADVGTPRSECTCNLLSELNPDVKGHAITSPLESFITQPHALEPYTFILVTLPIPPEIHEIIVDHAAKNDVPVFYIHSVGFYSHFTAQLPRAFPIVDTHPDPATTLDLRLLEPWPELLGLMREKTAGIEQMDDEEHGHLSYVLLLLHYLQKWRAVHDGRPPENYKEKSEFREMIRRAARTDTAEGGSEENFDEAVGAVLKALNPHAPSSAVREVFDAPECVNLTPESASFWYIAHAIKLFHDHNHVLPLSGSLPDMKSKSHDYITLQNCYKAKAKSDVAEVTRTVQSLATTHEKSTPIDAKEIEAFCKSAGYVKLLRGRRPHVAKPGEVVQWGDRAKTAVGQLTDPSNLILVYIAFLAYDSYAATHGMARHDVGADRPEETAPYDDADVESAKIAGIAQTYIDGLIKEAGEYIEDPVYSGIRENAGKIVQELVRARTGELHNISALTGGIIAQEVIKVITKQYVPVDNTCVFDGKTTKHNYKRLDAPLPPPIFHQLLDPSLSEDDM